MKATLFWLSQPRIHEDLAAAEADIAAGRVYDEAQVRQALSLPPRRWHTDYSTANRHRRMPSANPHKT